VVTDSLAVVVDEEVPLSLEQETLANTMAADTPQSPIVRSMFFT
jgi:hypothetical protein